MAAKTFGQLLRAKRDARGFSQETVANAVGCSIVWYGLVERDTAAPSAALASRIMNRLKFSGQEREEVYAVNAQLRPSKGRYAKKAG